METQSHFIQKGEIRIYHFHRTLVYLKKYGQKRFGSEFKFYKEDEAILFKLYLYAIHDLKSCEENGIDLNKGILLIGPVGCGKTSLMQVFSFLNEEKKYILRPTREITAEFIQDGFQTIQKYGKSNKSYCFDDLGVEQSIKHFGNESNVIAEILLSRYDSMRSARTLTHATTNLNADELEKMYGNRVRSRLREMFNLITFPSTTPDKRK